MPNLLENPVKHIHLYGGPSDGKTLTVGRREDYPTHVNVFDEAETECPYYLSEYEQDCGAPIYTPGNVTLLQFMKRVFTDET